MCIGFTTVFECVERNCSVSDVKVIAHTYCINKQVMCTLLDFIAVVADS